MDAEDIYVESRQHPISDVPEIGIGNQLIDDNNYLFTKEEYEEFVNKEPKSKKYFHIIYGSEEYINNNPRYCLYLGKCNSTEINNLPLCLERVQNVRKYRLSSKRKATLKLADKPTHFGTEKILETNFLIIPSTSSENRAYIPIGFLTPDNFVTHAAQVLPNATLYHFGILTSNVHMAWMRVVCGRLKSDYRYSKDIVYNNFPWPDPTKEQKKRIEETAKAILDARELYKEFSLAELYNIDNMKNKYKKLEDVHIKNNIAVLNAYNIKSGDKEYTDENAMVAHLFKLYSDLTKKVGLAQLARTKLKVTSRHRSRELCERHNIKDMSEVRRKEHRLEYYDYSKSNYYFITINTHDKKDIFGIIEKDKMILNDAGNKLNELIPTIFDNGKAEIVVF